MKIKDYLEENWNGEELTLFFVSDFSLTHKLDIYSAAFAEPKPQWFCEEEQIDYTQGGSRVINHQKTLMEGDIAERDMTFKEYMIKVFGDYEIKRVKNG